MPMPAITACLMVSVLRISIAMLMSASALPKPSSIECQVSEPRLAHDEGLAHQRRHGDRALADQRVVGRGDDHVGVRRERLR